jgi:hypothetical protein
MYKKIQFTSISLPAHKVDDSFLTVYTPVFSFDSKIAVVKISVILF